MLRKKVVTGTLGILILLWFAFAVVSFFSQKIAFPIVSVLSLAGVCFILGTNMVAYDPAFDEIKTAELKEKQKETWKQRWAKMSTDEKRSYVFNRIALPFVVVGAYHVYHVLINGFGYKLNIPQELIYCFIAFIVNLMIPVLIGLGIKKLFPNVAEKLNYA